MLDFNLERFKRLPLQPGVIWQGGLFRMPGWMTGEGDKPFRPLMALWVDPTGPRVSQPQFVEGEDPREVALAAFITFALDGGRNPAHPLLAASEGMDDDEAFRLLKQLLVKVFTDAKVKQERVSSRGGKYSILWEATIEFCRWYKHPWQG